MSETSIVSVLPAYIQSVGLIVGGWWAYRKFIRRREDEPATDIDVEVKFIGKQDAKWIIEITSFLKNQSLVRVEYEKFEVRIRYLMMGDKVEDGGEKIKYQLNFPRTIDERISGGKRFFENADYLNPKQEFRHRYITAIPVDATFVWAQCKLDLKLRPKPVKINAQRIFRVPESEPRDIPPERQ